MKNDFVPIPNFESYLINPKGEIYSVRRKKMITPEKTKSGYLRVALKIDKKTTRILLHRLVAQVFIPNPNNLPCVNHIDENRINNCVDNLEWCTYSYNINYGSRNSKVSSKSKAIGQYDLNDNLICTYSSATKAAKENGFDYSMLYSCLRGRKSYHTAYGFKWKYL